MEAKPLAGWSYLAGSEHKKEEDHLNIWKVDRSYCIMPTHDLVYVEMWDVNNNLKVHTCCANLKKSINRHIFSQTYKENFIFLDVPHGDVDHGRLWR